MTFTVMLRLFITDINSGVYPILYFAIYGSPDPTFGNKDKFGRLRSLCSLLVVPLGLRGKTLVSIYEKQEERQIASAGDDVGPISAYDCATRRATRVVRQRRQS